MRRAVDALNTAYTDHKNYVSTVVTNATAVGGGIVGSIGAAAGAIAGTPLIPGAGTAAGAIIGGAVGLGVGLAIGYSLGKLWEVNNSLLSDLGNINDFFNRNVVFHADDRLEVKSAGGSSFFADSLSIHLDVKSSWTGSTFLIKFLFGATGEDGTLTYAWHEIEISSTTYWLLKAKLEEASAPPLRLESRVATPAPPPPTPPIYLRP
jgi:hypothetical protein